VFRELASLFSIARESRYGLLARIAVTTSMTTYSLLIVFAGIKDILCVSAALAIEFIAITAILLVDGKLEHYLNGLKVIFLFVFLGALFYAFSYLTGIGPKSVVQVLMGIEKTALLIFPLTLAATWFTPYEVSYVLEKIGMRTFSLILRSALSKLPLLFIDISDAAHTIKLKYGSGKIYKSIYYLLLESLLLGNAYYEAYYIYGLPHIEVELIKNKRQDAYVVFLAISTIITTYLLIMY